MNTKQFISAIALSSLLSCSTHHGSLNDFSHPKNLSRGQLAIQASIESPWRDFGVFGLKVAYALNNYLTVKAGSEIGFLATYDYINRFYLGPTLKIVSIGPFRANWDLALSYNFSKTFSSAGFITGPNLGLYTVEDIFFFFLNFKLDATYGQLKYEDEVYNFRSYYLIPGIGIGFTIAETIELKIGANITLAASYWQDKRRSLGNYGSVGYDMWPLFLGFEVTLYPFKEKYY